MFDAVCNMELSIGEGAIKWMPVCIYLGVKFCSGKKVFVRIVRKDEENCV
jgi:hypothetical protein